MKKVLAILVIGVFLFGWLVCAYAKDAKMAYVDLDRVFEGYQKTKLAYKDLDNKLKNKEKKRKKMVDGIRRLKDEFELLSDKGKEEKQMAIDDRISSLNEFDRKAKDEFKKERINAIRDISNEIDIVIQGHGKKNDYDYIFSSRSLVFGRDAHDITKEILKILNKK
ncbi:MAG: OmpH family outer membrane protein [Candidatus Omnitrophica bacterium]|nr:OmpH family outer membrane protein [Candidatus Omnitrophota bacterium]